MWLLLAFALGVVAGAGMVALLLCKAPAEWFADTRPIPRDH